VAHLLLLQRGTGRGDPVRNANRLFGKGRLSADGEVQLWPQSPPYRSSHRSAAWSAFIAAQSPHPSRAQERLSAILGTGPSSVGSNRSLSAVLGAHTWSLLLSGLRQLCREYPALSDSDTIVYAPCVEGVGCYPMVDSSLRMPNLPLWVCGDATGLFRGNTAALVSGYYCGLIAGSA